MLTYNKVKKKNIKRVVKLIVPAGLASVSSSIGPLLGQVGLSAVEFCNSFNERTWFIDPGLPLLVDLWFLPGKREFTFEIKSPLTSAILFDSVNLLNVEVKEIDLFNVFKVALFKNNIKSLVKHDMYMLVATLYSYNLLKKEF